MPWIRRDGEQNNKGDVMMHDMMGGMMWLWMIIGILVIVLLVVVIAKLLKR
jgi:uncharacterized membrane protein